jgi:ion channel
MTRQAGDIFATAEALLAVLRRHRYAVLLGSLLLLMLSTPGVHTLGERRYPELARLVMAGLFTITLLSATVTVCEGRVTALIALWLAAPAILLKVLVLLVDWPPIVVLGNLFDIVFLGFTVAIGLRFLFRADRVTHGTIWASLCVYLLLGLVWADVYSMLYYLNPDAFAFPVSAEGSEGRMKLGAQQSVVPLYYSFVTMTTLGYGDIVPHSPTARILSALQAVMGQLYLAVLVARLVGLHISQSRETANSASDLSRKNP